MTREDKINMLIPTVNALTKYTKYYSVQCYNSNFLSQEINLDDMLYQCMILIAKANHDGTFTISNKTASKEELFSFIRNKIAHNLSEPSDKSC